MKTKLRLISFILALSMTLGGFTTASASESIKVTMSLTNPMLIQGQKQGFKVVSNYSGKVQYKAYLYSYNTKKWELLTNGYGAETDGNQPYVIETDKVYESGDYKVSVSVKKVGSTADEDAYVAEYFSCKQAKPIEITSFKTSNSDLREGQKQGFNVTSNYTGKVQYKAYIYSYRTRVWEPLTSGYGDAVDGNKEYKISSDKVYEAGDYKVSISIRKYGSNVDEENYIASTFTCKKEEALSITDMRLGNDSLKEGQAQDFYVISNYTGKVQYKAYIYSYRTKVWEPLTSGYGDAVDGNKEYKIPSDKVYEAGDYKVSISIRKYGSNVDEENYIAKTFTCKSEPIQITNLRTGNDNLLEGQTQDFYVISNYTGKVQYKAYIYSYRTKVWEPLTSGYGDAVDGNKEYKIPSDKVYEAGDYKVSISIRKYGSNVDEENYIAKTFTCKSEPIQITNLRTGNDNLLEGQTQDFYVTSNYAGKVQYRAYVYSWDTKKWELITDGYLPPVDGNKEYKISTNKMYNAGQYKVSISVRKVGSNEDEDNYIARIFTCKECKARITSLRVGNDDLKEGQNQDLYVKSDYNGKVQYKAYVYSYEKGTWESITNGYSNPVDGTQEYKISSDKAYDSGKYKVSVSVRKYGSMIDEEDYRTIEFNCTDNSPVHITDLTLDNPGFMDGEQQIFYVKSDAKEKVQYRAYLYSYSTGVWEELTSGYTSPVDGTDVYKLNFDKKYKKGQYKLSVSIKRPNAADEESYKAINFECNEYKPVEVTSLNINNGDVIAGEKAIFDVTTNYKGKIQYKVYLYSYNTSQWETLTNGYVDAESEPFKIALDKVYDEGDYKISVCVKRPGVSDEESYKAMYFTVKPVQVASIKLEYGDNSNIVTGFTVKSNSMEKVQYRVYLYCYETKQWNEITDGYSRIVDGNIPYTASLSRTISLKNQTYKISVSVKKANSTNEYDSYSAFSFGNGYSYYDVSMNEMVDTEMKMSQVYYDDGNWIPVTESTRSKLEHFIDPNNFADDEYGKFQFLKLDYKEGISVTDLNNLLRNKGVLDGMGQAFLNAGNKYNVDPIYLVAHAILETGNGTSELARGIEVSSVDGKSVTPMKVYNLFGIQAFDSNANKYGSEYAYKKGWTSIEKAIEGGAEWISGNYINNLKYNQNTLYKMKWNPNNPSHQYATDVAWAYNQVRNIKRLYENCPSADLIYEIPSYR